MLEILYRTKLSKIHKALTKVKPESFNLETALLQSL